MIININTGFPPTLEGKYLGYRMKELIGYSTKPNCIS